MKQQHKIDAMPPYGAVFFFRGDTCPNIRSIARGGGNGLRRGSGGNGCNNRARSEARKPNTGKDGTNMDPKENDPKKTEGTEGAVTEKQEPTNGANDAGAGTEGTEGQNGSNEGGNENGGEGGKPGATVNRHKYERELAAKDKTIAELQAQIDEAVKTKEGRDDLQKKLDEMKAELDGEKVAHKLEVAGCRNVKAARALLDDYDGDVAKLKEACPYLFGKDKRIGSTGFKPEGKPTDDDEALDRAFGLKKE